MIVFATFDHSMYVELAIQNLEKQGIDEKQILAVPLDIRNNNFQILDNIHHSDGQSVFDVAAVLSTVGMLLGAIYGFVLPGGPILIGIVGMILGASLGFCIKLLVMRKHNRKQQAARQGECILVIQCEPNQVEHVEKILQSNYVIGLARYQDGSDG
ncbi:hypothetical protein FY534_01155 [Alicyclobacillus sp. TC]|uniref:Uncharacterized protein n=2 Tax=Alicyclobacillus tolerans TaxID=90970 RepID=A0A1M6R1T1_9BACL|nr:MULTISPECIES: hypothetical protein [Alicyclobacillus]MDP9729648.1 hypothetical protein [Alicyclobacillus tengchongensis]QRF22441.1 hypothetical protein FY534_01155 [Alicyclobacillus sp. TC]SHK26308.1 hypothetical protein SAMN05443507_11133 [Alicyclobacillus montanus]